MSLYSYVLHGAHRDHPPAAYEFADDAGAIALSIAVLRDEPRSHQVWIMQDQQPVAVRIRAAGHQTGLLLKMR